MTPRESLSRRPRRLLRAVAAAALLAGVSAGAGVTLAAQEPGPGYALTAWVSEKGLPPGDVFAIAQDLDGYLWLGTPTGLLRFDGSRFTPWNPEEPSHRLPNGPVHALVGSLDGSLWVGMGGGGGVLRIHRDGVDRYSPADGAPPGVGAMIQDRQGAIWVATRRGVYRLADGRWTQFGEEHGYSGAEGFSLYEDRAGRVWVGTASGLYRWSDGRLELVDAEVTYAQSMTEDGSGEMWVTDPQEILKRLSTHTAPGHEDEIRLPTSAWRLIRDGRGQIWAAAFGGGLLRVRNPHDRSAIVERFDYEHRLAGSPRSLFEDREGNLWVGMRGGLLRLTESSFSSVSQLEGLTNDGVRTATVGVDGSVWVATGHGINRFTGSGRAAFDVSQTMALHSDRQGVLWISGAQQIRRLVNGRLEQVAVPDLIKGSRVMAMTTDAEGVLWLCTALRGVMSWDGKTVTRYLGQTELADRACQSIYADTQGRIWFGLLSGGVAVHDRGRIQSFDERQGLTRGTVLGIIEDARGAVWMSTSSGVSRIVNGRVTSITEANAPLTDLVPVLVEDLQGYIWVGVNSGAAVIRFHPSEFDKVVTNPGYQLEYALYDETDGMQKGSQTWQSSVGAVRGTDGRLWVATGLGMTVIDPSRLPASHRPPPPRIDEITADGRRLVPTRDLTLPAGTSTLRIDFGTISLSDSSKLRFRYMLEGLDEDWVYAGNVREATYADVPSGDYRFRVSTTANGEWTEAARWEFAVAPPFYRTGGFFATTLLVVGVVLGAAWWLRIRAVRNQYALVFAERARVSREIHDTLLQSLAAIGVELESIATELEVSQNPARDGLRRLRRQVGHCLREARESILELRNNSMRPRALVDTLRELAEKTTRTKGIQVDFVVTGRARSCHGDADVQLLRIAQEAVSNAVRHGRATEIRISLGFEKDGLVLSITDNGCGFVPDEHDPAPAVGEHLGLLTMRERAARIRGRLALISSPGCGTTIQAAVPLAAE
jgi:ligand-binding sensor domain-containing protein/signal transduction histidine kinase